MSERVTASIFSSPGIVLPFSVVLWYGDTQIFSYFSFFSSVLRIVPNVSTMIVKTVTFIFYDNLNSLAGSRYFSRFSISFILILWSTGTVKSTNSYLLAYCSKLLSHYSLWVFLIIARWLFFTEVWETASHWTLVSTPIFNTSSQFTKPLGIIPSAPITIFISVIFMLQSFF